MDVIADGSAVLRLVVVTENEELLPFANGDLSEQWEEVVWHALWVLAHNTAGVRASWVEVSEQGTVEDLLVLALLLCLCALSVDVVGDHGLDSELGVAVRVGGAQWALLGNGNHVWEAGGIAVDGRGGGKDDVGDVVLRHGLEEAESAVDVDAVVFERDLARFTDSLQSCEVNDAVNVAVLLEDGIEGLLIGDIALGILGLLAADQLNAVDDFLGGVVEVVNDDDLVAGFEEGEGGE